jgi:hypothetical protein
MAQPGLRSRTFPKLEEEFEHQDANELPRLLTPPGDEAVAPAKEVPAAPGFWQTRGRSILALAALWGTAPFLLLWALTVWLRYKLFGPAFERGVPKKRLNILVTGGKMTKASAVARAVGRDGHRVFTAEILPYRYCHTRFCGYVEKHYVLPRPVEQPQEWQEEVKAIVKRHNIDLIIPCTAPVESSAYAHLRDALPANVRVFAFDGEVSDILDNKFTFNQELVKGGLPCPETANMECFEDGATFFSGKTPANTNKRYIVKPSVYDPAARTEILFLPVDDQKRQNEYLRSRNASVKTPYVIQEVLSAPELGSYAVYNQGFLTAFELFESCASCLKYEQLPDKQRYAQVLEFHKDLGRKMNLTGQLTLDLMHDASGRLVPIECNPRIHSAVCTLEGHRNLGAALTDPDHKPTLNEDVVTSQPLTYRYFLMDQIFLRLGFWQPKNCFVLSFFEMLRGRDALLHGDDPSAFLAMYLLQIPSLLLNELVAGTEWLKIDFCIGKIVKEGGD